MARWTVPSQVPSQPPATPDHSVSKSIYEQKDPPFPSPHTWGKGESILCVSGLRLRWVTLEPAPSLLTAMKEQAHYPGWQMAGIGRQ